VVHSALGAMCTVFTERHRRYNIEYNDIQIVEPLKQQEDFCFRLYSILLTSLRSRGVLFLVSGETLLELRSAQIMYSNHEVMAAIGSKRVTLGESLA